MNYIKKNFTIDYIICFTFVVSIFFWNINLLGSYLKFFFLLNFFLIFFDNKKFSNNYFYKVTLISSLITFFLFYHIIFDIISFKFYFEKNTILNVAYVFLSFFQFLHKWNFVVNKGEYLSYHLGLIGCISFWFLLFCNFKKSFWDMPVNPSFSCTYWLNLVI